MRKRLGTGLELALRSALGPAFLSMRWTASDGPARPHGVPTAARSLSVMGKILADELFFASEVFLAASPRILSALLDRERLSRELAEALALADREGWLADPASYHGTPPPLEKVSRVSRRAAGLGYEEIAFESGYVPHEGEPGRARWQSHTRNRIAYARCLRHAGPPRPWVLCIPGYRMGHPHVDFVGFRARWLHQDLGLNVAIPVMPLHGPRAEGLRSGDGFLTGDLADTLHAVAQAVWDVRRLAGWLRRDAGAPALALKGLSLGAYTTGLVAGLEPDLDCVIAGVPAADFVRLARHSAPPLLRWLAERAGFPWEAVERVLRLISPLALVPLVPRERRFLFAGLVDRLATPDHAHDLWEHWDRPRIAWYQGGHVSFCWEGAVQDLVHEALSCSGLVPAPLGGRVSARPEEAPGDDAWESMKASSFPNAGASSSVPIL